MPTAALRAPATLGADLLGVVARLNRMVTQQAPLSLPFAQARLLAQIEDLGPARISELAAADHCSQPTMTTQVQRLEAHRLVTRRADPSDARAVLVSITTDGRAALAEARTERAAVVAPHLADLDPEQQRILADAVDILRDVLAAGTQTPEPPSGTNQE